MTEGFEITQINEGVQTAFIDYNYNSTLAYRPQFISNNYKEGKKVLTSIEDELLACDSFQISVAFITLGGIEPLLLTLQQLEQKGIKGQILTTNYLNFSDPKAIEKLHSLKNLTIKMYDVDRAPEGFHTKGYIFRKAEIYRIIVGSANITSAALTSNREWNTKIVSTQKGEYARQILEEYNELWSSEYSLDYNAFIDDYKEKYRIIKRQREAASNGNLISIDKYKLSPNSMQVGFIKNLREIIAAGENKALLISATGTGKTYASAFAMRELGFKKVLFLVHRGQLAKQTKTSYEKVFDKSVTFGLIGAGNSIEENSNSDYLFAMIQTLSRDEHIQKFAPDRFDCIILDEAHHSSAASYQKIMNYFKPKLWLGMTATPDKRDDNIEGRNIYEIFNHQIAYEIRLQQAMEEDMLCPFHYFGLSDISMVDDSKTKTRNLDQKDFNLLTGDERVKHIIEQAEYFGYSGERVKGIIFCSRIDESKELSAKFNNLGFRTIALNGDASEDERVDAFERLAMEETDAEHTGKEPLDYIFSVEILNEGVDIVEVNQVIMLRPTQSPIVFIQQLGRGLRKAEGKEFVVVLDFIGNYENNFMIPIALSGDRTYNKDNIRRYVIEGGRVIPGASTVHFDEVSKKKIFSAIDNANFSDIKLIKENYTTLKNKLGHIPALKDFDEYGEMDVLRIFDNSNLGSYYKFLVKYEKEYTIRLSEPEDKVIEFVSKKLASGKRIQELQLLNRMLAYKRGLSNYALFNDLKKELKEKFNKELTEKEQKNIINILTNEFPAGGSKGTYADCVLIEKYSDDYKMTDAFRRMVENEQFYAILKELVEFGISRYQRDYSNTYRDTDLVLYQKYTYEDVCHLLNWENNEVPLNIGGYKYDKKTKTFPVFINYDKAEDISDTTKYEDHFVNNKRLIAISKAGRSMESEDVQNFLNAKERGIHVELFVRKNKDDKISKEFYYLGRMEATGNTKNIIMANTDKGAVEIEWNLDVPIRDDIYEYITSA